MIRIWLICGLFVSVALRTPASDLAQVWSEVPFRLRAGDAVVDTNSFDQSGHAAPFLIDLDRDGNQDLVLGTYAGKFRFFRNSGIGKTPHFLSGSEWLRAEGQPARVANWCCMAAAPQFVDLDGDGVLDLTAGSYGGPIYWLKGLGGLDFKEPRQLLSIKGPTVLAHPESFWDETVAAGKSGSAASLAANVAWTRWNDDLFWDLLLGSNHGELFIWKGQVGPFSFGPPDLTQFRALRLKSGEGPVNEILINGKKVLPEDNHHAAPAVADWDGDGLWDILLGSQCGDVYFLRNTGAPGAPEFKTRELLLEGGQGTQLLSGAEPPAFGIRTQIHATDYNQDSKMDLLVGCFSATVSLRADLTSEQRSKALAIWTELEQIDRDIGNTHREVPVKFSRYFEPANKDQYDRVQQLMKELHPFLNTYTIRTDSGQSYEMDTVYHGNVWVFLRK